MGKLDMTWCRSIKANIVQQRRLSFKQHVPMLVFIFVVAVGIHMYTLSSSSVLPRKSGGQLHEIVNSAFKRSGIVIDEEQKIKEGDSWNDSLKILKKNEDSIGRPDSNDWQRDEDKGKEIIKDLRMDKTSEAGRKNGGKSKESMLALSGEVNATIPQELELNYTVQYRKFAFQEYSDLFLKTDEGTCQGLSCKWSKMPGATRELVQWAPEVFRKVPSHFLGNFKNPCWVRDDANLNCLPYYYMIGMSKCGTTDIWSKIAAHPDVVQAPKEPHWWGPRRNGYKRTACHKGLVLQMRNITGSGDDRSLEWYLNFYKATVVPKLIKDKVTTSKGISYHHKIFGDASISTASSIGLGWTTKYPNASEPLYTNADLLRAVQPNSKIILVVRDPTPRTISWYWINHHYGGRNNESSFHDYVVENIACLRRCMEKYNPRYCAYAAQCPKYNHIPQLQVGLYYVYTRDWMKAFSREGVLVIRLEDWEEDPLLAYRKVIKFLDLRELSESEENRIMKDARRNVNRRKGGKPCLPETRKILEDFFRPYNEEMARLMNDDKFLYPANHTPFS